MAGPKVGNFIHFVSELFSVIAVVHHQTDVLQLQLEWSRDLIHHGQ